MNVALSYHPISVGHCLTKIQNKGYIVDVFKNNEEDKSEALYILKGLACLGVIFIHCPFPSKLGNMFTELCCFAVPVFYLIAGYYSYNVQTNRIKARIIKLLKFALCCFVLYLLLKIGTKIIEGGIKDYLYELFSIKNLINIIVFSSPPFWEPGWYIIGMIETYITWLIAKKYNKTEPLLKVTPFLFIIGVIIYIVCNTYFSGFGKFIYIGRALPWFLEGIIIRDKVENKALKVNNKKICIIGILAYIFSTTQSLLEATIEYDYLGTVIYSLCLFLFFIYNSNKIHNKVLKTIGKKYSKTIYAYHSAVIAVISIIFDRFLPYNNLLEVIKPLICLTLVVVLSVCLTYIKENFIYKTKPWM